MGDLSFNLDDSLTVSDLLRTNFGLRLSDTQVAYFDSFALTTLTPGRATTDSLNLADSIRPFVRYGLTVVDTQVLSDLLTIYRSNSLLDTLALSDTVSVALASSLLSLAISSIDGLSISDSLAFLQPERFFFGASLVFSDSVLVNLRSTDLAYLRRYLNDV